MTITTVIPQLRTTDLKASIDFYVGRLGFTLAFVHDDFYAGIRIGDCAIHLKLVDDVDPSIDYVARGEHIHLYFTTDDVTADAERFRRNGVVFRDEVAETAWGTREFWVLDNQGHTLCFGQQIEVEAAGGG